MTNFATTQDFGKQTCEIETFPTSKFMTLKLHRIQQFSGAPDHAAGQRRDMVCMFFSIAEFEDEVLPQLREVVRLYDEAATLAAYADSEVQPIPDEEG